MNITLDLQGLDKLRLSTQDMVARMTNLMPVWDVVHDLFRVEMYGQFASEGQQVNGEPWQPLSEAYAKRKPETPTPFDILYRTGKLYRSLVEEGNPDHVFESSPTNVLIGTRVTNDKGKPYPLYHQRGDDPMPERRIIGFSDAFRKAATRVMLTYVLSGRLPEGIEDAEEIAYRWR